MNIISNIILNKTHIKIKEQHIHCCFIFHSHSRVFYNDHFVCIYPVKIKEVSYCHVSIFTDFQKSIFLEIYSSA